MCLEALLGYSIVRFEFNSHIVELGRDHFRHLSSTESAMQFRLRGKTAPNLHIIVFANLEKTWSLESPDLKVPDDLHLFLRNVSCFSLFIPMIVKLELKGKEKKSIKRSKLEAETMKDRFEMEFCSEYLQEIHVYNCLLLCMCLFHISFPRNTELRTEINVL